MNEFTYFKILANKSYVYICLDFLINITNIYIYI